MKENTAINFPAPVLPSGTLTFLFTDIEGSSRLWEKYPEQMRVAMTRHDELIESAVTQYNGVIVRPRGEGDSRFAVFKLATDAVRAARSIQQLLAGENWKIPEPPKVRIALHTGEADLRDEDYYGTTVNRCARIRGLAHGGQTLITQITYELVRDSLPEGVATRDLGEHTLRDLNRSEHIYQLVISGLNNEFPPIVIPDARYTNLPSALTSFIGREREMAKIKQMLSSTRMLTITGAGGIGKTRLALQVGSDLLGSYNDGIWFIDLAPLSNQALVVEHVVQVLGIKEEDHLNLDDTLLHHLREKAVLLIFDNCEHLLSAVAPLTEKILHNSPWVRILATSREPLGVSSEVVWWIPSLSTPDLNEEIHPEKLLEYEAVKLFVDRAVAVEQNFAIDEQNAQAVSQICAHLDGIPLAIELAAARVKVLSVSEIAERLDDRFRLLVGSRTALLRQQTLRALIDWSYELLSENERILLGRLSIFSGGWSLQVAEDVCSGGSIHEMDVVELLSNLVEKSLVLTETRDGEKRYRFLETIHRYSRERLEESSEASKYARKHAEYFSKLTEDAYGLLWGPKQGYWLRRLEEEYDNIRKALGWLSLDDDCNEMFLTMAGSLWRFWEIRGNIREGRSWLERALAKNPAAPVYLRANGLRGAGNLARQQGDYGPAKSMHEQSLALFRELDDKLGIGRELDALGEIAYLQGDYERSVELHTESLAFRHEIRDKEGIAVSLGHLGIIARDRGRYQYAEDLLQESLKISRELEDKLMTALSLTNLGRIAHTLCEYQRATSLFEESVSLYRELNDRLGISNVLQNLGDVARDQGNFAKALKVYQESIELKKEIGDRRGIAYVTASQGEVAFYQGNYSRAAELTEMSLSLFENMGVTRGAIYSKGIQSIVFLYQGEFNRARALANELLEAVIEINAPRTIAYSKEIFGLDAYARGEFEEAHAFFKEAFDIFQKIEDRRNIANLWINLARTAYREGDRQGAMKYLNDSVILSRELDLRWTLSFALEIIGLLERDAGNYKESLDHLKESLALSVEQSNQQGIANCLGAMGGLAVLVNEPERAACMFAASERIRRAIGAKMGSKDHQEYEHYLGILKNQLDVLDLTSAWTEGSVMTTEQIMEDLGNWSVRSAERPSIPV